MAADRGEIRAAGDGGNVDKAKRQGDAISAALRGYKRHRRHPHEVTSDRIGDAILTDHHLLSGAERDTLSAARDILERLAESGSQAESGQS